MATEALKQLANRISGQTTKACMYFIRTSCGVDSTSKPKVTIQGNGSINAVADYTFSGEYLKTASGGVFDGKDLANYNAQFNADAKNQVNAVSADIVDNAQQAEKVDPFDILKSKDEAKTMKVSLQFNPSSIHIDASGGGLEPVYNTVVPEKEEDDKKAGSLSIKYRRGKEHINIRISTVFDALSIAEAFMGDDFNIENVAKGLGKYITSKLSDSSAQYSIRPVMEGFLAAFSESYRQMVYFVWGELTYTGILTGVDCTYTMFNRAGEPVRATVNFNILSSEANKDHFWEDRYKDIIDKCVDSEGNVKTSTNTSSRIANNLINLQL